MLVLLYAQGATAISRMTVEQIHIDAHDVRLQLGRVPIQLPEPVAALARTVVAHRKGHATIEDQTPTPCARSRTSSTRRTAPSKSPRRSASRTAGRRAISAARHA